ncbi:uncharacterized protein [Salminus brasiliensis]|uniref:uncharacterized protein n=1 Tax=Salminus brasiliensis TaxID=930266 RepID=UPI003B82C87E
MAAKRNLPSWMSACASESSEVQRSEANTKKRGRQKRPERVMLYWMNERELAETALSALKRNHAKTEVACPVATTEVSVIPETDTEEEPDLDVQERTCGSDSDVDVAEQQTVPYITCIEKERSSRSDSAGDQRPTHSQARGLEESSHRTKTDPEALQLVREIFFR